MSTNEMQPHSEKIDLQTGQRAWEGDHRVVIVGKWPTWDSEILIDGKPIQDNTPRVQIDIDCDKAMPIVALTRLDVTCEDEQLQQRKQYIEMLTANQLNITLEEARVVDVILNQARQEATSNAKAVQLFSITDTDERGEQTTQILGNLLRDAARYRALRNLVASSSEYLLAVDAGGYDTELTSAQLLDEYADMRCKRDAEESAQS